MNDFYTYVYDEVTSTMDAAKQKAAEHNFDEKTKTCLPIFAIVAQKQTSGRGRGGSTWLQAAAESASDKSASSPELDSLSSPASLSSGLTGGTGETSVSYSDFAQSISLQHDFLPVTFVFPSARLKVPLEWVTTLVGAAIYDAIITTENFLRSNFPQLPFLKKDEKNIVLKWPNDLITYPDSNSDYKKICGVLCEASVEKSKPQHLFIGIGLNFFNHPEIKEATSFWQNLFSPVLNKEQKREVNKWFKVTTYKAETLKRFSNALTKELTQYLCEPKTSEQLQSLVLERSIPLGTVLSVNKGTIQGAFAGINEHGALLLKGHADPVYSGDVILVPDLRSQKPASDEARGATWTLAQSASTSDEQRSMKQVSEILLAIDFGNSRIHMGLQSSRGVKRMIDIAYDSFANKNHRELRNDFKPILEELLFDKEAVIEFIYISVITSVKTIEFIKRIKDFLNSIFPLMTFKEQKITEAEIFECTSISGDFEKDRLGADRAIKFLFAAEEAQKNKQNVLVFSFGTAVTCEGVAYKVTESSKSDSEIKGNLSILENFIFPGVQMAMNALNHYTALVPLFQANVELFSPQEKNWNQEIYIQRGVFFSVAAAVLTSMRLHAPCKCYITGGNAPAIQKIITDLSIHESLNIEVISYPEIHMLIDHKKSLTASLKKKISIKFSEETLQAEKSILIKKDFNPAFHNQAFKDLFQTMSKARTLTDKERFVLPKQEDFRRIGRRLENVNEAERLDGYMAKKFPFQSRNAWFERISNGEVLLEHLSTQEHDKKKIPKLSQVKPTYKLKDFDQIWSHHPHEYEPEAINEVNVVFDNGDLCVFSKPPNIVIHEAGIYKKNTFVNLLENTGYKNCSPVHRIDRETSGILVCARIASTRRFISEAFKNGAVDKMYLAVTKGTRPLPDKFRVTLPIGRDLNSSIRLRLWAHGENAQSAETWFANLGTFEDYTLYACLPKTGRTNQIRIHLAAIGHWILGDKMYHKNEEVFIEFYEKGLTPWVYEQILFPRHMLHNTAIRINDSAQFKDPFVCEIPADMMSSETLCMLMKNSGISINTEEQRKHISELFLSLHKLDFSIFPEISIDSNL